MKIRGLWLIVPWVLFIVAALGWVFYWNYLAGESERRLQAWVTQQNASGGSAEIERMVRHGFPVLLRLELQNIAYAPARGGWRIATQRADLNIDVLNPQHLILEAEAPIAISRSDGSVTNMTADQLIASLRTARGSLAAAGVEADNLMLDDPAQDGVLRVTKLVTNLRPDPRAAGEYQLQVDLTSFTLPRPVRSFEAFGQDVAALKARIVIEDGAALLDSSPNDPLGPWREAGGRLRIEGIELNWGPLETIGTGEGGLDEQRRLNGRLVLPVDRPAPVLNAIATGPNVDDDARQALQLLAAGYLVTGDDITLDIGARDGVLNIEGLPVRPLPPVY